MFKYIDISTHQKKVEYESVKNDGVQGVLLRAGHTGYARKAMAKDELFETHYAGFKKAGVPVIGVYYFSRATNLVEAHNEAKACLQYIEGKDIKYVYFDTEDEVYQAKVSKDILTRTALQFLETIEAAGYKAGLYAGKNWLNNHLYPELFNQYEVWLAQYYHTKTYVGKCDIWQYTSSGRVKGISGDVDMNWGYKDYHTPIATNELPMSLAEHTLKRSDIRVTSPYGMRMHPTLHVMKMHDGVDISTAKRKLPCYALEKGVVSAAGYDRSAGNYVKIKYTRLGLLVVLFHLDKFFVKKGQVVDSETLLGIVGTTGDSTGIHLHIGVQLLSNLGKYIDPLSITYKVVEQEPIKRVLYLSKVVTGWRVYPLNKDAVVGNEIGKLAPSKFGGLKYTILESLPNSVYVIETATFGKVKIWAGKGSLSTIKEE